MSKFTVPAAVLVAVAALSSTAIACPSHTGQTYIGERSANPEHETYGYVMKTPSHRQVGFVGPARFVGMVTGEDEKNTIAYRPLLASSPEGSWASIERE